MSSSEIDLNPVSHITVDAIGQPGKRIFYIQGWQELHPQPATIIIEKIQLQSLVLGIKQMLVEIANQKPADELPLLANDSEQMRIIPPVDPLFRAGELGLGYDSEQDLIIILTREIVVEGEAQEEAAVVRFWCNRQQARQLADWGQTVIQRGRPICPQCGEPMEAEGHFCPKKNGHKKK